MIKWGSLDGLLNPVLLQTFGLSWVRLLGWFGSGSHPEQAGDKGSLSLHVSTADVVHLPFLTIAIASKPASVLLTVRRLPTPNPGRTRRLIQWWSCSIMLFRYLRCRNRAKCHSRPVHFRSRTARG